MTVKETKRTRRKYGSIFKAEVQKMVYFGRPNPEPVKKKGSKKKK